MTNQPLHDPQTEQPDCRQAALQRLLESAVPPTSPNDPDLEKTIQWIVGHIDKGLCRIYAVHINECLDEDGYKRLVERVSQRINDPQLIESLKETLAASPQPELAPQLADIVFESIDHILQQAKVLGREENFLHVQCTRIGNELIVLADRDPRYEWILPAVQKRLREELSNLHYDPAAIETQALDLTFGHRLRFLDFELRLVKDRHGETKAHYRLVEKNKRRYARKARARLLGRYHPLRFLQPVLNSIGLKRSLQIVEGALRKANSIQASWLHLPVTLFPVLMLLFGWRSLVPWLDLAAIFACNWYWPLAIVRWAGRHKLDTVLGACAMAALICISPLLSDIYANRPREIAVSSSLPPGFYLGEYHGDLWWNGESMPAVNYGLYLPPHLQEQKGPFPLIVFLHGFGERTKRQLFKAGLPAAIAQRFGANKPNGPFPFIAFFPIDPTGHWRAGSAEVEGVMMALDYVIGRHRIDPSRVYLAGHSAGGSGVWQLAQTYPNKWAAVAPVCASNSPDVGKVRHIPAWIFHGAKDAQAPVARARVLVRQLQEAKAEVRYTEFPDKDHGIWPEVYNTKELYEWLAGKKKG